MSDRTKIVCPNCDALIATVPEGRRLDAGGLICSNCGAALRTSNALERMVDKVRDAVGDAEGPAGGKRS